MGTVYVRASRRAKAYRRTTTSLVKSVRRTAKKFAPQTTIAALKVKYDRGFRHLEKSGHAPDYNFNGYVRKIRARALGKKTSIYG